MSVDRYTIKLKSYLDVFIEKAAGGAFYPGALLLLNSSDAFIAHNDDAPAAFVPIIAIEDALQGKGIDDAYASGDWVRGWVPTRGDVFYGILADGEHVAIGEFLQAFGTGGFLEKQTGTGHAVAMALEHKDLSGSSDAGDSSEAPLGYAKRIKCMVI
jgi:hypothetical protein